MESEMELERAFGSHFLLRDFVECSETWKVSRVSNVPKQEGTLDWMASIVKTILDPVVDQFGRIELTFAFCSPLLRKAIVARHREIGTNPQIYPATDQHAGCELNKNGVPICRHLGFAVDFRIESLSSRSIARWIIDRTPFDNIYYYGSDRPLHVSVGPAHRRNISIQKPKVHGRGTTPVTCRNLEKFDELVEKHLP